VNPAIGSPPNGRKKNPTAKMASVASSADTVEVFGKNWAERNVETRVGLPVVPLQGVAQQGGEQRAAAARHGGGGCGTGGCGGGGVHGEP
jgi:hypothetical protein